MKFEPLMLQTLFRACLLVCVLTLGAMPGAHPAVPVLAAGDHAVVAAAAR
jgi:hypothetical protein